MDHPLAYVDIGSGSLIVQFTIASIIAIPFFLRTQIRHGIEWVRVHLGRTPERDADESEAH